MNKNEVFAAVADAARRAHVTGSNARTACPMIVNATYARVYADAAWSALDADH
ncbi:hypothetical protein SEA_AUSTIN_102 [Gordonia phage Austin]|nr:hypothetical protein SEA_AUSTIN_102 [Gordonia phage Austin]